MGIGNRSLKVIETYIQELQLRPKFEGPPLLLIAESNGHNKIRNCAVYCILLAKIKPDRMSIDQKKYGLRFFVEPLNDISSNPVACGKIRHLKLTSRTTTQYE
jgi:hypothetical protein